MPAAGRFQAPNFNLQSISNQSPSILLPLHKIRTYSMTIRYLTALLLTFVAVVLDGQSFIQADKNYIQNEPFMGRFLDKLHQLEQGDIDRVRIVHIGDSHVQAGFWTGDLRYHFQKRFGDAGRGLVFPFRLAETNNPLDIRWLSNKTWTARKNIYKDGPPIGLSAASISIADPEFYIELIMKDSLKGAEFDQITLFNNKGPEAFDFTLGKGDVKKADIDKLPSKRKYHKVRSGETLYGLSRRYGCSVRQLQRWNGIRGSRINIGQRLAVSKPIYQNKPSNQFERFAFLGNSEYESSKYAATLQLEAPTHRFIIKGEKMQDSQKETIIYGMSLEKSNNKGVLYHEVGVNGATFYHYNKAEKFFDQIPLLEADLVIISLGTNESLHTNFEAAKFQKEAETFIIQLRNTLPNADFLLLTNGDAKYKGKKTKNVAEAREVLRQLAFRHGLALWDQYEIMGGDGAIDEWKGAGLSQADRIHYTKAGYAKLAELLYQAIEKSYDARY